MNLQGLTVIFAIILLPIIIVVSVYLQGQIDTIALQTKYDNMLLDSTHDAVIALENNIANEDLSTVSDSLRSMIEASTNVFMNNIATNLGLSNAGESYIRPYIPALLYTLYDGFYIYSPTSVPEIYTNSDGVALRVGDKDDNGNEVTANGKDNYGQIVYKTKDEKYTTDLNDAEKHIKYVLKSYMYYNANYVGSNYNISVNYSLDNYISLSGTIGKVYYSKSGYLINPDKVGSLVLVNNITDEGKIEGIEFNPTGSSLNNKEEVFYKKYGSIIKKLKYDQDQKKDKDLLSFGDEAIIEDFCKLDGIQLKVTLNDRIEISNYNFSTGPTDELISQATDAICYYGKAKIFSDWVNANLNKINPSKDVNNIAFEYSTTFLKEEKGIEALKIDSNIFKLNKDNDPEDITSDFWEHKREVIKSSIQYNLNLAISNYSSISSNQDYQMPILSETEWDKVLSNISMVSFMQDLPCKGKTYNNYAIVTSANSELIVIPDNLYFVPAEQGDNAIVINSDKSVSENKEYEYHRIDCEKLSDSDSDSDPYYYLGYRSIEYLYDRKYENKQYEYDHKNFACYYCIVTGNYSKKEFDSKTEEYTKKELSNNKKRAYYTVLGKERNNLYKTTATVDNYGFEVTTFGSPKSKGSIPINCSRPLNEVRSIEVVITKTEIATKRTQNLTKFVLEIGDVSTEVQINANKNTTQTIVWDNIASEDTTTNTSETKTLTITANDLTTCNIASVKVIYK